MKGNTAALTAKAKAYVEVHKSMDVPMPHGSARCRTFVPKLYHPSISTSTSTSTDGALVEERKEHLRRWGGECDRFLDCCRRTLERAGW